MSGWKTKLAAGLSILYGIAGWLLDLHGFDQAMDYIITGIGLLGVAHKIEKAGRNYLREHYEKDLKELVRSHQSGSDDYD